MSQEQSVTYAIVFSGQIVEGFQLISVKAHLAKMLKASPEKMAALFSGKPVVIKRTADKQEAAKYGMALKKVGADVKVKIIRGDSATAKPVPTQAPAAKPAIPTAAVKPATQPTATPVSAAPVSSPASEDLSNRSVVTLAGANTNLSPDFSLAENEGDLFEPSEKEAAVVVNIDAIDLAENDGSPIIEPTAHTKLELDLSAISIAENDGSPIAAPREIAEKIEAPEFDLDEPGAVLETLKEEVELVDPDVSSISLAFPGSDLLNPDEIDKGPEPVVPDVSNIKLVANRATFDLG